MQVICIVQARMNSKRLPGKVMKEIQGIPIIGHILNSLSYSKKIDDIVVATTTNSVDDILVNYLEKHGWKYFRGKENDVLLRYVETLKKFPANYVVRITADNPLIDPEIVDSVIDKALETKSDYVANHLLKSFPLGMVVEVISAKILLKIEKLTKESDDREHVTWYVYRNKDKFKTLNVTASKKLNHPQWRLTVDTKEDFQLIEKIINKLYKKNGFIQYSEITKYLLKNPDLLKINKNIEQKNI
jgi:spore coat polysaccharide biosynthesis protein SpsF